MKPTILDLPPKKLYWLVSEVAEELGVTVAIVHHRARKLGLKVKHAQGGWGRYTEGQIEQIGKG